MLGYNSKKCSFSECTNTIPYLSHARICLVCGQSFCKKCFYEDDQHPSIWKRRGWCTSHYLFLHYHPEPESLPKNLPTDTDIDNMLKLNTNVYHLDPFTVFDRISDLGSGAFSKVYKVKSRENGDVYALKHLNRSESTAEEVRYEFSQSAECPCANIVRSYALYEFNGEFYILQELLHITLLALIAKLKKIPEDVMLYILKEITQGLDFIHSYGKIHRDIKSENIFINTLGSVKIGDLGCCVQLTQERCFRNTLIGSPLWIAPEVVAGESYAASSDIWSLGIVAVELVEGIPPHSNSRNLKELFSAIANLPSPEINSNKAPKVAKVFNSCLKRHPLSRKTAEQLLKTEELQQNYDNSKDYLANYCSVFID